MVLRVRRLRFLFLKGVKTKPLTLQAHHAHRDAAILLSCSCLSLVRSSVTLFFLTLPLTACSPTRCIHSEQTIRCRRLLMLVGAPGFFGEAVTSPGWSLLADVDSQIQCPGDSGGVVSVCVCAVCSTRMRLLRPEDKLRCRSLGTIHLFETGSLLGLQLVN